MPGRAWARDCWNASQRARRAEKNGKPAAVRAATAAAKARANGNGNGRHAEIDVENLTAVDLRRMALSHLVGEMTGGGSGSSVRASLEAVVELGGLPGEIASAMPMEARAAAAAKLFPEAGPNAGNLLMLAAKRHLGEEE